VGKGGGLELEIESFVGPCEILRKNMGKKHILNCTYCTVHIVQYILDYLICLLQGEILPKLFVKGFIQVEHIYIHT
jgi:hypothetical protein